MPSEKSLITRPPIGCVVEGHGEYSCYPSLVCRIAQAKGFRVPIVNAGGFGRIVRDLGGQLTSLVLAYHPFHVLVTIDLRDVQNKRLHSSCADLVNDLQTQARVWMNSSLSNPRLQPLPARVVVVVQIQKFEPWMIADVAGLIAAGYLTANESQVPNVDEISDPIAWIRARAVQHIDTKNPMCARNVVASLDTTRMRMNSHSFDKFFREVSASYECWLQTCQQP